MKKPNNPFCISNALRFQKCYAFESAFFYAKNVVLFSKSVIYFATANAIILSMTVYVEFVILDNMAVDCFLLWGVGKVLRLKTYPHCIFLGGAIGTFGAFAVVLWSKFAWAVRLLCAFAMCLVCFGKSKLVLSVSALYLFTFALGGSLQAFSFVCDLPIAFLTVSCVVCCYLLAKLLLGYLQRLKVTNKFRCNAVVNIDGKSYRLSAYADSGNVLCVDGLAVCFVLGKRNKIFENVSNSYFVENFKTVSYQTVGGKVSSPALKGEVVVNGARKKVYLAFGRQASNFDCQLLLNSSFLEVENETD